MRNTVIPVFMTTPNTHTHTHTHTALGAAVLSASMALATCGVKMLDIPVASSVVS